MRVARCWMQDGDVSPAGKRCHATAVQSASAQAQSCGVRIVLPLESGRGGGTGLSAQVAGFSRGAEGPGEKWPNSHIFSVFLTWVSEEIFPGENRRGIVVVRNGRWDGFVRFGRREKARKSAFVRFRPVCARGGPPSPRLWRTGVLAHGHLSECGDRRRDAGKREQAP